MKTRLFPTFATFAILALAAVAPAQDRGRRGGSESRERSSPSRSQERSRPERNESRGRSEPSTRESRPDRSREERPSRTEGPKRDESRPADNRPDRNRDRDSRPNDSRTNDSRPPTSRDRSDRDSRTNESRPGNLPDRSRDGNRDSRNNGDRTGGDARPSRPGTPESGRRNPFERSDRQDNRSDDRRPNGFDNRNDRRPNGFGGRGYNRPNRSVYAAPSRFDGRGRFNAPVRFGTPPIHSVLGVQIRRTDARRGSNFAFGGTFGGLRVGYVSYGNDRFNQGFGYRYYAYDPFTPDVVCVASPWYRYSYLPPYIDNTRVIVVNNYPSRWDWNGWNGYDDRSDRRDAAVQGALDDLRDAFEESNDRYGDRLVPQDGSIAVYNEGRYDYSLNAEDFRDMFLDGIDGSKTIRYEILEVRTRGDEVRLRARHTFEDSWGSEQSIIHTLTLRRDRGGDYVIREFGSE